MKDCVTILVLAFSMSFTCCGANRNRRIEPKRADLECKEITPAQKKEKSETMNDVDKKKYSQQLTTLVNDGNEELFKVACQDPKIRNQIEIVLEKSTSKHKEKFISIFEDSIEQLRINPKKQLTEFTCSIEALLAILKNLNARGYDNFSTYDFLNLAMDRNPITIIRLHGWFCEKMVKQMSKDEKLHKFVNLFKKEGNHLFTGYGAHGMMYEINNLYKYDAAKCDKLYTKLINFKKSKEHFINTLNKIVFEKKVPLLAYAYVGEWNWHSFAIIEYNKTNKLYKCSDGGREVFYTANEIWDKTKIDIPWFMRLEFNHIFPTILYIKKRKLFNGWANPLKVERDGTHTFVAVHKDKALINSIKL